MEISCLLLRYKNSSITFCVHSFTQFIDSYHVLLRTIFSIVTITQSLELFIPFSFNDQHFVCVPHFLSLYVCACVHL
jgi:hypothetical protein